MRVGLVIEVVDRVGDPLLRLVRKVERSVQQPRDRRHGNAGSAGYILEACDASCGHLGSIPVVNRFTKALYNKISTFVFCQDNFSAPARYVLARCRCEDGQTIRLVENVDPHQGVRFG
ncbi:hypothetical protein D9M70_620790 [compost metagenome]